MKKDIHPKYVKSTVTCACGNTFETMSLTDKISVEICDKCHPFYTGQQSIGGRRGKVEQFNKKYGFDKKAA